MKNLSVVLTAACLLFAYQSLGQLNQRAKTNIQLTDSVKNTNFTLTGQYQFMLSRAKTVNGYKLINPYRLTTVWKSVTDTLNKERLELKDMKKQRIAQSEKITQLQAEIQTNQTSKDQNNTKINEITILGISMDKGIYSIVVWSIIGLLAIVLFFVITRSVRSQSETKSKQEMYSDLLAEFQAFKAKSNEKERKLARELQDERNIVEELKERGRS